METPEPIVHTVDTRLRYATALVLCGNSSLDDEQRCDTGKACAELWLRREILGQLFAEKTRRHNDLIGSTKAAKEEVAKTAADRIAHEQRPGEHGDGRRHTEHDGYIRAPVVGEAAKDDLSDVHSF
jgi:hypothetical protein